MRITFIREGKEFTQWRYTDIPPQIGDTVTLKGVEHRVTARHWVNPDDLVLTVEFGTALPL